MDLSFATECQEISFEKNVTVTD